MAQTNNGNSTQCNTSMYKSLCICSPEFEKIPITRRDLGATWTAISYTLTIGETFTDYKIGQFLENQRVGKGIQKLAEVKIMANFGILNFLYKKVEGKSNERATIETGVEIGLGYAGGLGGKLLTTNTEIGKKIAENIGQQAIKQTNKVASKLAIKTGVSLLTRIATGAATGAAIGSAFPIVGTIIGAIVGAWLANGNVAYCRVANSK